jgi:hypothetical protein
MTKYSVQFEKYGEDSDQLICSAIKLSDRFCDMFPVSSATGYVDYMQSPPVKNYPFQEFWFAIIKASDEVEAYQEAILSLLKAKLEKSFPLTLSLVYDDCLVKEF